MDAPRVRAVLANHPNSSETFPDDIPKTYSADCEQNPHRRNHPRSFAIYHPHVRPSPHIFMHSTVIFESSETVHSGLPPEIGTRRLNRRPLPVAVPHFTGWPNKFWPVFATLVVFSYTTPRTLSECTAPSKTYTSSEFAEPPWERLRQPCSNKDTMSRVPIPTFTPR